MSDRPIEISGITPVCHFPNCPPHHPCTEFCEIDKLCIPSQKVTLEKIKKVCLKVCILSFKVICTPAGKKLIVNGKKQIKVFFVPDGPHHCIHSADFEIPFCTFVLLKDCKDEVVDVCSVVEDISVNCEDHRYFTVTSIIFVCPVFKKNNTLIPLPPTHDANHQINQCATDSGCYDKQACACYTPHNYHSHSEDQQPSDQTHSVCQKCKLYSTY